MIDRAYEPRRWRELIAVIALFVTLAALALSAAGCASAPAAGWEPFEVAGVVIGKGYAPGVTLSGGPDQPKLTIPDRWVLLIQCGGGVLRAEVTATAFLSVHQGQQVIVRGERRGGEYRGTLILPGARRAPEQKGSDT